MPLKLDLSSSCFLDLTFGEGAVDGRVALSACLVFPDTVAKSPTVSWQMAKACSAPRRGQLLMRTLMQLHWGGRGLESWGWAPGSSSSWFLSLAPSEPVSAGPRHLGRGTQRRGKARPSVLNGRLFQGSKGAQGTDEARMPT